MNTDLSNLATDLPFDPCCSKCGLEFAQDELTDGYCQECNPQLSACCQGTIIWLLCEDDSCPDIHEFAICEICGADVEDEYTPNPSPEKESKN